MKKLTVNLVFGLAITPQLHRTIFILLTRWNFLQSLPASSLINGCEVG